ncbi:MAG: hypothetical protein DRI79_02065 [Chloroflexi bacterium]|nr:MAG: hypothetical protein DRI79_02065 [Chloroflexota bacterium]
MPAPAEIPDWLREAAPPEVAAPEVAPPAVEAAPEAPVSEPPVPAPAEIPDWLREAAPPEVAAPEVVPPTVEAAPEAPVSETPVPAPAEIPDWLREAAPPEVAAPEVVPPAVEAEGLARAEIPDWLEALRPRPEVAEAAAEEEPVESEGLLEGLRGLLPPATAIQAPPLRERALPAEVSEASLARAQLLQSLLARPAEVPRPKVRRRGVSIGERIQRWLVAAVLLVAVGGVLMAPLVVPNVPALTQPAVSPGASRLYEVVQSISAGDAVLVAFEYGPSEADELNLVAEPILRHLFDQGAHISVVSTRPEGLTVAAGLLNNVAPEGRYALLGYRSGEAAGVSQLLTEGGIRPRVILVLTARPAPLRWWVEQTRALYGDTLPVVAGVSAALQMAVSPYLDVSAGQLKGAIYGLSGAAAYETLRESGWRATQRLDALAAGHVAIVGLMLLGAVFYAFGGARRRGK